jgi:hypothetical protein
MSNTVVGSLAGFFFALFLATIFLYHLARRNTPGKVVPFWQGCFVALVAVIAVSGMVGISIAGQEHFHGSFQEDYLFSAAFIAFFGVFF